MKVFLSWSGETSHKVAKVFRDWLPSVIQSIVPYVSSEDIDKGARWSTDIANELENSTYGILCVTKDNFNAPWISFEAGALSKTIDKSFVCPFLFDIKRAEVDGPILQFQSTIFERDDLRKLIGSLNKACDVDALTEERLEKAFEVWYPELEKNLNELLAGCNESPLVDGAESVSSERILEEILDLTRDNQKILIRNGESDALKEIGVMKQAIDQLFDKVERGMSRPAYSISPLRKRRLHPMMFDEIFSMMPPGNLGLSFQMALGLLRTDFPWLYDSGVDLATSPRI